MSLSRKMRKENVRDLHSGVLITLLKKNDIRNFAGKCKEPTPHPKHSKQTKNPKWGNPGNTDPKR